jgi:transcription initiation factor TFIIIB Brf1 subunit/transcription initiation factor TFIIB
MNEERCPECGTENALKVRNHEGNVTCQKCAVVYERGLIDQTNEIRQFEGSDNTSRVNARANNSLLPSCGHATMVSGNSEFAKMMNKMSSQRQSTEEKNLR